MSGFLGARLSVGEERFHIIFVIFWMAGTVHGCSALLRPPSGGDSGTPEAAAWEKREALLRG